MMDILRDLALKLLPKFPKSTFIIYNVIMEKFGWDQPLTFSSLNYNSLGISVTQSLLLIRSPDQYCAD